MFNNVFPTIEPFMM